MIRKLDKLVAGLLLFILLACYARTGGPVFNAGLVGGGWVLWKVSEFNSETGEYLSYSLCVVLGAVVAGFVLSLLWCAVLVVT